MTRVLVIDNYDSFTYNLVQYLGELGAELEVVRNDAAAVDGLLEGGYDRVVVSPGPCTPNEAGISVEVMRRFPEAGVPTLGVCLGHQSLAQAFGGRVVRHVPVHGKARRRSPTTARVCSRGCRRRSSSVAITRSLSIPSSPTCWSRPPRAAAC